MQDDANSRGRTAQEEATQRRAQVLGMNYIDTSRVPNKQLFQSLLSVPELYRLKVVPLNADQSNILFGVTTTTSQMSIAEIKHRFLNQITTFAIISDAGYADYMRLYDPPKQVVYHDIALNQTGSEQQIEQASSTLEQVKASDMLAYLVSQAYNLKASDIHIESQKDDARIRYRIDGVLHQIARISEEKYRVLVSAIASAGNISTAADEAQQGHITQVVTMADHTRVDVNVRVETIATINGMDIVMRLFHMEAADYRLDHLGLSPAARHVLDQVIDRPSGLVMVVGPTGSGKTTTLYSVMNSLNNDERKIITIEDPVEYQFPGITQISVGRNDPEAEVSFAETLRAVLRLDPDIVMVGEVRDNDTAKTALQAALTGHLVLTTFHAGSAAAALTRLGEVIGQNPLFVSAIRLIMAQRLVRRLDDATKQAYTPDDATRERLYAVVNSLPEGVERPNLDNLQLYRANPSADNPYGFRGQLSIREQLVMSPELRQLLAQTDVVHSTDALEAAAQRGGMQTMYQDGVLRAIAGETTLEEITRVLG